MIAVTSFSCGSSQRKDKFKLTFPQVLSDTTIKKSEKRIDNHPTYESYFTFEKNAECISIEIDTKFKKDEFTDKMIKVRTFFVIEKKMGLDKFAQKQKAVYTAIGKNYTDNWRRKQKIVICTNKLDPLKQLTAGTTYRIRFTTFKDANYGFKVNIILKANVKIKYL